MADELFDQRVQLVTSTNQIRAVDEWRRQQTDIPNRSAAIRRLIDAGLKAGAPIPMRGQKPEPSGGTDPEGERSGQTDKPPRSSKPSTKAAPVSKEAQLRAMREQGAR